MKLIIGLFLIIFSWMVSNNRQAQQIYKFKILTLARYDSSRSTFVPELKFRYFDAEFTFLKDSTITTYLKDVESKKEKRDKYKWYSLKDVNQNGMHWTEYLIDLFPRNENNAIIKAFNQQGEIIGMTIGGKNVLMMFSKSSK